MKLNQTGAALGAVLVFTTIIVLLGAYVLSAGYNQTKQINSVGIQRTKIYFRAQAGVVDAMWRMRVDALPPGTTGGSFFTTTVPADPPVYYIDIDTNTFSASDSVAADVKVDIGSRDATTGLRSISSTGLDK